MQQAFDCVEVMVARVLYRKGVLCDVVKLCRVIWRGVRKKVNEAELTLPLNRSEGANGNRCMSDL